MTKLTAVNSPLLALIKSDFNKQIFKAASMLANANGEAAVVEYMMEFFNDAAKPAARKRYTAMIAGKSRLLDAIRDWYGNDLFRIAALEYVKDGETAAIDVVCGARAEDQKHSELLRRVLSKFCKPAAITPGEAGIIAARAEANEETPLEDISDEANAEDREAELKAAEPTVETSLVLAQIKRDFNAKIYKRACQVFQIGGEADVVSYAVWYFGRDIQDAARARYVALMDGTRNVLTSLINSAD